MGCFFFSQQNNLQVSPSLSPVCSSSLGVEGQSVGTPVIMCRSPTGNELQI